MSEQVIDMSAPSIDMPEPVIDRAPLNLFFVRHGESEGNKKRELYCTVADHAIHLTQRGREQGKKAGQFLGKWLKRTRKTDPENFGIIRVWYGPYYRTRGTALEILSELGKVFEPITVLTHREDPLLFEQKAGLFDGLTPEEYRKIHPHAARDYDKHVEYNGRSYAYSLLGESRMSVVDRVLPLFRTILEDYRDRNIRHVIVVNHGVTVRAMTMRWMRYSPEWLDAEKNPGNCWIRHIHGNGNTGYTDDGYIRGTKKFLHNPMATQRQLKNAGDIFMLKPQRPNTIVPKGVKPLDPFAVRNDR